MITPTHSLRSPGCIPGRVEVHIPRIAYTLQSATGLLAVDGEPWGVTLEDRLRRPGVKVWGNTCIPAGRYRLSRRLSPQFKRWMIWVLDVPGFDYVYMHGGNDSKDTLGCLLIARQRTTWDFILGSLEKRLYDYIDARGWGDAWLTVTDGPGAEEFLRRAA